MAIESGQQSATFKVKWLMVNYTRICREKKMELVREYSINYSETIRFKYINNIQKQLDSMGYSNGGQHTKGPHIAELRLM